jgi:predicted nucleic acid-binding protein
MGIDALRTALAAHKIAFVDTMVFAYLLDEHAVYADLAEVVLAAVESGSLCGVTSALTLAELLTGPARMGNLQAMREYELYLTNFPNLTIVPVDTALARSIAQTRAATGMRMPDAVQIAAASFAGVDVIIGNDKQWRGKVGSRTYLILDDFRD